MKHAASKIIQCVCFIIFLGTSGAQATTIQEVTSPKGVRAWLVEDDKLPILSMSFAFRGGVEQDPASKQGLADLTMALMTEGAGPYDAAAFQQQLANHSIEMRFAASRDVLTGQIKMLRAESDPGFDLLREVLIQPRFDAKAFDDKKDQQLTELKMQFANPGWQARYGLFRFIFRDHPYGQRHLGSIKSLASLTREDVRKFAADHLAQDNLVIVIAGNISAQELRGKLDHVFGGLPQHNKNTPVAEVHWPVQGAKILIPRDGTQTQFLFSMPGPKRNDHDWYAAEIANYILGGGGFSSRIMQDVRDKKGLTYGIDLSLNPMQHAGLIVGEASVDNPKALQAWDTIEETMRHFYNDGASAKEITAAKDFLTGALPLSMTSTDRIASVLLSIQLEDLGVDYLEHRNQLIRDVTEEDVDRVIHRWFDPDYMTLVMVGQPESLMSNQTQALVRD